MDVAFAHTGSADFHESRLFALHDVSWSLFHKSLITEFLFEAGEFQFHLLPLLGQTEWQERSPLLGYYAGVSPKSVGEVLLNVQGRRSPAMTYQTLGKGRVAVVSAGPLWRWKFLSDNNAVYNEIMARLLDVLSRGRRSVGIDLKSPQGVEAVLALQQPDELNVNSLQELHG